MKKELLISFTGLSLVANCFSAKNDKPNIVLIYMDDLGYGDIAVTGAQGYQTPNIDQLGHDGMVFTQFYSPCAVSSASRAGLLTGCYPNRIGIYGALQPKSKVGLNPKEENIAKILKAAGYKTAMVGKWHLGDAPQFMPTKQGFDAYFGLPYSNDMWPYGDVVKRGENAPEVVKKNTPQLPLYDGEKVTRLIKTQADQDELTTLYTERAVNFIKENKKSPFFLYLAHSMPHIPLGVSSKFRGKSELGIYGDVMMEIDWSIAEIVKTLKEIGATENTLIIFTSDNGPWLNYGDHAGSAGGLKEAKMTSFEGGQKVPCIMKWPAVIPAGKICNKLASAIDILPTLCNITESKLPVNKIDGVNILPLLKGDFDVTPRQFLYYYYGDNDLRAVRDARFKLVVPHGYRSYEGNLPGVDGKKGKVTQQKTEMALYDLRRDQGERYDVQSIFPEAVMCLTKALEDMRQDIGDSLTGSIGKNVRPAGKVE